MVSLLASLIVAASVSVGSYFAFEPVRAGTLRVWMMVLIPNATFGLYALTRLRADRELRERLLPKWGDLSRGFFAAAVLFVCAYAFNRYLIDGRATPMAWLSRVYTQVGASRLVQTSSLPWFALVALIATSEELTWRLLVTRLLENVAKERAWLVSALLYSLAHAPTMWALRAANGSLNPLLVIAALGAGVVWGGVARIFGRVAPSVVSHVLFDWAVLFLFPLYVPHA